MRTRHGLVRDLQSDNVLMTTKERLAQYITTEKQRAFETDFLLDAEDYETWDKVEIGKPQPGKQTFTVKSEDILAYNVSMLETDPLMIDEKAAQSSSTGELIQHPIFVTQLGFYCIERGPGSWIRTPGARNPGQRIEVHEPFKVGETITMTVTPVDKWIRRGKHYITNRLDFHNEDGALKTTWWLTLIIPPTRDRMLEFAKK